MLKRCIAAEWMKLRHSRIWAILFILPVISVLIGLFNFYMNQGVLRKEWYSLWSQVSLFYGEFFFPILIAICCAYIWRLEHFNKNWNMMMTSPVTVASIFLSKLIVISVLLFIVQGLFILLYFIGGKVAGLSTTVPSELSGWFFRGWISAITISTLQLALSMHIRSFAIPIGIGFCSAIVGLVMYMLNLGMFFPHSLLTIGMGILSQTGFSSLYNHLLFFAMNLFYSFMISIVAIGRMRKLDVAA